MDTRVTARGDASHRLAIALTIAGLAASCICGLLSGDAYFHLDDVTHFLYAKWSWQSPKCLLDDWGRPGFTVAYFLPSALGWTACRMFSALLTAAAAWFAYLTARKIELPRAWLVIPLCYAQPLYFLLSQTTLTETPLAFYLSLATWLAVTRRWTLSSFVLSAALVTRHEAIVFLPIWGWFAWRDKARWFATIPILWAPILVNGLAASLGMHHVLSRFLDPTPTQQYGHGGWLTFFVRALHAFGPAVTILAIVGLRGITRHPAARLVAASTLMYFLAQTIVFRFGLFASGGYSRFLIGISPLVAIVATNGLDRLLSRNADVWRRANVGAAAAMALLWISLERQLRIPNVAVLELPELHYAIWGVRIAAGVLALLATATFFLGRRNSDRSQRVWRRFMPGAMAILLALTGYAFYGPLPMPPDARLIDDAIVRLNDLGFADAQIITAHPYFELRTGGDDPWGRPSTRERIERAPIGSLVIWESRLMGSEDHNLGLEELQSSPAFREILQTDPLPYQQSPYLHVFEKLGPWGPDSHRVASPARQT
ncbi:MAG: hypothetical protein H6818_10680 [Phycisphaerales bacterium]|nr:hypothetical protein [Phycisphaerales bacterium]